MRLPGTNFEYGRPQFFATLLLVAFLVQSVLLITTYPRTHFESHLIHEGLQFINPERVGWSHFTFFGQPRQPLTELLAAIPVGFRNYAGLPDALWLPRIGFLLLGFFLGTAIWWVARRLYGDAGGYIALALYCLSPYSIRQALADNDVGLALGWFSMIFVAIGLAHNLYAPPRHWVFRTTLLLIAVAAGISLNGAAVLAVPLTLALLLYLAPGRRRAAAVVWFVAVAGAFGILKVASVVSARLLPMPIDVPVMSGNAEPIFAGPVSLWILNGALVVCVGVLFAWRRARYFGNWAPLLVFAILLLLAFTTYHVSWGPPAFVFAYIFIAGICADLLETRYRRSVLIAVVAFLVLHAATGLYTVFRLVLSS